MAIGAAGAGARGLAGGRLRPVPMGGRARTSWARDARTTRRVAFMGRRAAGARAAGGRASSCPRSPPSAARLPRRLVRDVSQPRRHPRHPGPPDHGAAAGPFLAYLFFFPTHLGRPHRSLPSLRARLAPDRTRAEFLSDLDSAVHRIFRGFLYKFILAALVKRYWLDPAAATAGLLGTLSLHVRLHLLPASSTSPATAPSPSAFSYLFGVHTPENFDRPFLARNIREFWNRWHISLSWWLRDHVYMRFVLAATKGALVSRVGTSHRTWASSSPSG